MDQMCGYSASSTQCWRIVIHDPNITTLRRSSRFFAATEAMQANEVQCLAVSCIGLVEEAIQAVHAASSRLAQVHFETRGELRPVCQTGDSL